MNTNNSETTINANVLSLCNIQKWKLSFPLLILFGLNGASIAFPGLAYMSIINDRVKIPLDFLSAYGAISFLPWSLKPLYAFLASLTQRNEGLRLHRHYLISLLLLGSGISIIITAFIPEGGIVVCFLVAFFRAILSAFPEFLLGLTLVDEARLASFLCDMEMNKNYPSSNDDEFESNERTQEQNNLPRANIEIIEQKTHIHEINKKQIFDKISGMFQAQAATARNIGSLISSIILFLMLILRQEIDKQKSNINNSEGDGHLTKTQVTIMLLSTGLLPIIGSFLAIWYKVGSEYVISRTSQTEGYGTVNGTDEETFESTWASNKIDMINLPDDIFTQKQNSSSSERVKKENSFISFLDVGIVLSLQLLIVMFGIKQIIVQLNPTIWNVIIAILALLFVSLAGFAVYKAYSKIAAPRDLIQRGPAFFLILKHAMPNISYQWSSYTYFLFRTKPIYLQILSLAGSIMSTCGSKVYESYIAPRFGNLRYVFVITTFLTTAVSFLYIIPAQFWKTQDITDPQINAFLIVLFIGIISSFTGEVGFLPSVVLATNSVRIMDPKDLEDIEMNDHDNGEDFNMDGLNLHLSASSKEEQQQREKRKNLLALEYGTYVACIDFGDQLASWITIPIISFLSINRGDWSRMGELICICAGFNVVPLLFLWTLPGKKKTY